MSKFKKAKHKSISDTLTYAYIRKVRKWIPCPACKQGKMSIDKKSTVWTCEDCGYKLPADEFEDDYVFWFCDGCGEYLNNQRGFNRNATTHICEKCGFENDISPDNLKGICIDCGKILPNPDTMLCVDCKIKRKEKAKERLLTTGLVAGAVALAVGAACDAVNKGYNNPNDSSIDLPDSDYPPDDNGFKCATCGNTNEDFLFDEGDTVYCSVCHHRTLKSTGQDDVVECPYCHRLRDRKAMYCRYCNDSTWLPSTPEEFKEIDDILKEDGY